MPASKALLLSNKDQQLLQSDPKVIQMEAILLQINTAGFGQNPAVLICCKLTPRMDPKVEPSWTKVT